jgi:hypothetical protein
VNWIGMSAGGASDFPSVVVLSGELRGAFLGRVHALAMKFDELDGVAPLIQNVDII